MAKKQATRASRRRPRPTARARPPGARRPRTRATVEPSVSSSAEARAARAQGLVAAIGASAGGLEALTTVLEQIEPNTGIAFVVVQHLAPKHESFLAALLAPTCRIPVVQVRDGMALAPNRVHVIPPDAQMTVSGGALHLAPRPTDRTQYNPVDAFFQSLAASAEHRAVGVVLSGSASDGAAGIREIKSAGGFTIAQHPRTARYDGMPRAAIATGMVDLVLPAKEIGLELVRLGTHPFVAAPSSKPEEFAPADQQLDRLFHLLRKASGVDFTHYKIATIKRRLQRRMALHRVTDLEAYLGLLEEDQDEARNLYRDVLIHVTRFFREPASFAALKDTVFPSIVEEAGGRRPIRIWVPGCATGEDAYSIAIALLELLGQEATSTPIQVFGTDVSEEAIEKARAGVYPETIAADVSADRLRRFFMRTDGQYRISKIVRDSCIFARQDLTRDPPFSKLDLIVCRNVLIYLDARLQRKLMGVFHYALKPAGFLMLGTAESIGPHGELFGLVDKRQKIYRKRQGRSRKLDFHLPPEPMHTRGPAAPVSSRSPGGGDLQAEVTRLLVTRYAPPSVILDQNFQIVQTRGRTGAFLELAAGDASLNILKMAREGLVHALRGALQDARKTLKPVRRSRLVVKTNGYTHECDVQVFPLAATREPHFLVTFESPTRPSAASERPPKAPRGGRRADRDPEITRLQQELNSSREYLQSIIQDLEAANEELQSANEEILSSNEELQSTNEELDTAREELQSTNEELNTVNDELNARNTELNQLNSDLINLLGAVPAAIVIVSSDLRIRRFTPLAEEVLNLIPSDVGRPIGDIKPNLDLPELEELTRESIDNVTVQEGQRPDRNNRLYQFRIRPYKDQENRINGAVLTFTELHGTAPVEPGVTAG